MTLSDAEHQFILCRNHFTWKNFGKFVETFRVTFGFLPMKPEIFN